MAYSGTFLLLICIRLMFCSKSCPLSRKHVWWCVYDHIRRFEPSKWHKMRYLQIVHFCISGAAIANLVHFPVPGAAMAILVYFSKSCLLSRKHVWWCVYDHIRRFEPSKWHKMRYLQIVHFPLPGAAMAHFYYIRRHVSWVENWKIWAKSQSVDRWWRTCKYDVMTLSEAQGHLPMRKCGQHYLTGSGLGALLLYKGWC